MHNKHKREGHWVTTHDGEHVFIGGDGKVYGGRAAISQAGGAGLRGRALANRSKAAIAGVQAKRASRTTLAQRRAATGPLFTDDKRVAAIMAANKTPRVETRSIDQMLADVKAHNASKPSLREQAAKGVVAPGRGTPERIGKARELVAARSNLHAMKAEVESSGVKAVIKSEKRMPHDPLFGLKNAVYDPNTDKVIINPGPARAGASRESLLSTARHEVGHALHQREGEGTFAGRFRYAMTAGRQWQNPRGPEIAGRVSKYARTNQREFVADTYRGMREGKQYDPEVMKLYHQLGGPGIAAQRSAMARELVAKRRAARSSSPYRTRIGKS